MKRTIIYLVTAALLALAGCDRALEPAGGDAITIEASVGPMTKVTYDGAGTAFEAGDQIALYAWTGSAASVPAERAVNGVVNTLGTGGTWTPASLMRWETMTAPHFFLGVSPAPATAITDLTAVPYTLDPDKYTASDLLLATNFGTGSAGVTPSSTPVPLEFEHAMAKLAVNLKFRTEWETVPTSVSVAVTAKTGATVNYLTKAVTATGTAAPVDVPAAASIASGYDKSFSGLQVPQDGVRRIAVTVDGLEYAYEYGQDIPLKSGIATTLGLIMGHDRIELEGISVADWETETLAEAEAELDMRSVPLTIEAAADGVEVHFNKLNSSEAPPPVMFRVWNGSTWDDWYDWDDDYVGDGVVLNTGEKIQFKAKTVNESYCVGGDYSTFSFSEDCYVYGNIMSLIDGENFSTATELTGDEAFKFLFADNTHLLSHPLNPLLLPATSLSAGCYEDMFRGCTSLTIAPKLPAETLADFCYEYMFAGCTGLTVAPELPATELSVECYQCMFFECTGLTTAPELPATTLASDCYFAMFDSCTNLTTAPALPVTTLASKCYSNMFANCTNLTTAPALPATTLADKCYSGMFFGCTSLTTAPVLPATALVEHCYYIMFEGCSQLNSVTCLATDISAPSCTEEWLKGVAAIGTFTTPACMEGVWPTNTGNGIPPGWTRENSSETVLEYKEPGSYLPNHTRIYVAGVDQYVREYDGDNLTFVLMKPADNEQMVITGYSASMQVGDAVTLTVDWRRGTTRLFLDTYAMTVVKEENRKVWIADNEGKGFVVKK